MSHYTQKLSFREKAGYSLGDGGANLVFQVLMAYQFFFFTRIMGISPAAAGLLFLVGRFFDAVTDPMMGIIADRTKTRWGRFRPWLLWSALPFAGIFWMTFTSPGFEPGMQTLYAYVMYFVLMAFYTINNVPYCALGGVMTGDVDERTSLNTFRFVSTVAATFVVQGLTLPLVEKFGQGDDVKGWSVTIAIYAVLMIALFVVTFLSTRERVEPDPSQATSVKQDIVDLFKNRPWAIMFAATLVIFIMLVVRGGSLAFFMEECIDQGAMYAFLQNFNLAMPTQGVELSLGQKFLNTFGLLIKEDQTNVSAVTFGFINMLGNATTLIGVLLSKPLSSRFGKKTVFMASLLATALCTFWLMFIPGDKSGIIFIQGLLWGACYGPSIPLLWSMIADTADYSEWKTGRRSTAFAFAGVVFALKFGLGVGGFIQGMILSLYGYEGGDVLSESAIRGFLHCSSLYPAILIVIAVAIMAFYPISKALNYQIADELAERRKGFTR